MTTEELEQKVKRLEEELTEVRIALLESKADKKPYEVELPDDIGDYVFVTESGNIKTIHFSPRTWTEEVYRSGLLFKTEEEAEKYNRERMLLFKLHKWAEEHNEGWKPNWKDMDEEKRSIEYDNENEEFKTFIIYYYRQLSKLPYFKSKELAEQFIEEFGEEIKEVFC